MNATPSDKDRAAALEAVEEGLARSRRDDWAGAADRFRRATALDPNSAEARFRLGWALFKESEEAAPTPADLALGYGAQLLGIDSVARDRARKFVHHKKLLRESVHWLRETLARDPSHARARYYLARALKPLGYPEDALEEARKARDLEPSNTAYAGLVKDLAQNRGSLLGEPAEEIKDASPRLGWDDVVLDSRTKRELRQVQLMLERPDQARELGVEPPTGILLRGAPGTGKTTIARVLANEAKCRFFNVTPAEINQMFVGESEKRIRDLFARARAEAPSIIFIDEIDALLPARQGGVAVHSDKVVNQFLQEMDGMKTNERVLIVGATNRPDMLDAAVRRGGRLSREIEIPLPDFESRVALLRLFTAKVKLAEGVDIEEIAKRTEGYSGADLRAILNDAGLQALIRIADSGDETSERAVQQADFEAALDNFERSEDE